MRNISDQYCRKNQNTCFIFNKIFLNKIVALWDKVKKYCTAGRATDNNMAHTHCMLDTNVCKHTFRICNTYCFSTATMVARTRIKVTLHVICLSCLVLINKIPLVHTWYRPNVISVGGWSPASIFGAQMLWICLSCVVSETGTMLQHYPYWIFKYMNRVCITAVYIRWIDYTWKKYTVGRLFLWPTR
jgi:hypothetical protein